MNRKEWYNNVYLKSFHFRSITKSMLLEHHKCEDCGKPATVLHHQNYLNLGKEMYGVDVVALCDSCHGIRHNINRMGNR